MRSRPKPSEGDGQGAEPGPGPQAELELEHHRQGLLVAGVDECGRGSWAGPLTVGAVVLDHAAPYPLGVRDSKLLTAARRCDVAAAVRASALGVGLGWVEAAMIDRDGLPAALTAATLQALATLPVTPDVVIIDGPVDFLRHVEHDFTVLTRVKADRDVLSVAAASVVAKCERDAHMTALENTHPGYGFAGHKGYMTLAHRGAVERLGLCEEHRRSWRIPG